MSQAKVDRYKKEKANRKKEMQKEKASRMAYGLLGIIIAVAIVSWVGYSAYNRSNGTDAANENAPVQVNTDAIDDYLNGLGSD